MQLAKLNNLYCIDLFLFYVTGFSCFILTLPDGMINLQLYRMKFVTALFSFSGSLIPASFPA